MSAIEPRSAQFRREREARWRELEVLVQKVETRGLRSLSAEQLQALPILYRGVISSLSVARAISLDRNVVRYLEALAQRAYFVVYSPRRTAPEVMTEFFRRSFPRAVREIRGPILLAFAISLLATLIAYSMVRADLDDYYLFVAAEYAAGRDPTASTEELRAILMNEDGDEHDGDALANFAAHLFSNNARIGLLCYAVGIVPVLLVGLLLFQNFALLGAFAALHAERGLSVEMWSWILPHGVTELLAVIVCAGAGLTIGLAWFFPGERSRIRSLVVRSRTAGVVAMGSVLMFLIAALIEGFFRQLVDDIPSRYLLAASTALFWSAYFGLAGRRSG
ncbi:MAG: stage II sporulation protein M [Planctomycetota bacterium]